MTTPAFRKGDVLPKTYNSVLKEFQLRSPDLSSKYDVIMLDEAQDINPCQADIIGNQTNCRVIVVGDPHQVRRWNDRLIRASIP